MNIKKFLNEQLPFLKSSRFWQVVIAFVFLALGQTGTIPSEIATAVAGILGVSVSIKTVDKFADRIAEVKVNQ